MPSAQSAVTAHLTHLETIALNYRAIQLNYRAIQWNHEACGTSGGDDWRKPAKV
jgi:type VI secretion system secreted protein Hcp